MNERYCKHRANAYCSACNFIICEDCVKNKHKDHENTLVKINSEDIKEIVLKRIEKMKRVNEELKDTINKINEEKNDTIEILKKLETNDEEEKEDIKEDEFEDTTNHIIRNLEKGKMHISPLGFYNEKIDQKLDKKRTYLSNLCVKNVLLRTILEKLNMDPKSLNKSLFLTESFINEEFTIQLKLLSKTDSNIERAFLLVNMYKAISMKNEQLKEENNQILLEIEKHKINRDKIAKEIINLKLNTEIIEQRAKISKDEETIDEMAKKLDSLINNCDAKEKKLSDLVKLYGLC